jgi:hypothetical protein
MAFSLVACGTVSPPIDSTSGDRVTLYYVESQRVEPWGPELSGRLRTDWEAAARDDLNRADLTPSRLEQVDLRAADLQPAICDACPSLFVLMVDIPRAQEGIAIGRCFVRRPPDFRSTSLENMNAARRTDCSPLYR